MASGIWSSSVGTVVVLLATSTVGIPDDKIPLGHKDFRPSPAHPVGWRGDGTGVFPGAGPPAVWSDGTEWRTREQVNDKGQKSQVPYLDRAAGQMVNVLWRTLLPNWSNSSPIVVGKRVFVVTEPVDYAPILICMDADTGATLWKKEVNHLDAVPGTAAEIAQVKKDWSAYQERKRLLMRLGAERRNLNARMPAKPAAAEAAKELADLTVPDGVADGDKDDLSTDIGGVKAKTPGKNSRTRTDPQAAELEKAIEDWTTRAGAAGVDKAVLSSDIGGLKARTPGILSPGQERRLGELSTKYGCNLLPWEAHLSKDEFRGSAYTGYSHPTPVSDGQCLYVFTGNNCAACFDLDGVLKWIQWLGPWKNVGLAGWMDFTQSPVLVGNKLLVATKQKMTALDTATGRTIWQCEANKEHGRLSDGYDCLLLTGVPLRVAGTDYFFWYDGRVYRVADGQPVTERLAGASPMYQCCCALASGDVLVYFPIIDKATTAVAVRLSVRTDGSLSAQELWRRGLGGLPYNGIILQGKVYVPTKQKGPGSGLVADLRTGNPVNGVNPSEFMPDHLAGLLAAGERLMTVESTRGGGCCVRVYNPSGKMVAENRLSDPIPTQERLALIRSETGRDGWSDGFYHGNCHAVPFFTDDRIFIHSRDELICVGPAIGGTPRDDPAQVQRIRAMAKAEDAVPFLDSPSAQYRYEAAVAIAKRDPKVASTKWKALALGDPYEEIRAVAVRALDAADPAAQTGVKTLQEALAATEGSPSGDKRLLLTCRLLGPEYVAPILLGLMGEDAKSASQRAAISRAADLGITTPAMREALLSRAKSKERPIRIAAINALCAWPDDPTVLAFLRSQLSNSPDREIQDSAYGYVRRNIPPAEQGTFFFELARSGRPKASDAVQALVNMSEPPAEFFQWISDSALKGDADSIRLARGLAPERARAILLRAAKEGKAPVPACAMLLSMRAHIPEALTVLATASKTDAGGVVATCGEQYTAFSEVGQRKEVVSLLLRILQDAKDARVKASACGAIAKFGADAASALEPLETVVDLGDSALTDAANKAIAAINGEINKAKPKRDGASAE